VKIIEGTGSAENDDGLTAVCASCLEPFDERGGLLFDEIRARGLTGLCIDCVNRVVETVAHLAEDEAEPTGGESGDR
jgi:hypothetical protein